jgi:hypothetical protein
MMGNLRALASLTDRAPGTFRRGLVALVGVVGALALVALFFGSALAQEVGWPTPPAGPGFSVPSEQVVEAPITESVDAPGSVVKIIRPSWPGPLPLIPPIPTTELLFTDASWSTLPLTLWVDAGTFGEVVQVRVTPVEGTELPAIGARLLLGFEIEFFDTRGNRFGGALQRPIRVNVPVAALRAAGVGGERLLFWIQTETGIARILTAFNTDSETLTTRLISPGVLVLADES